MPPIYICHHTDFPCFVTAGPRLTSQYNLSISSRALDKMLSFFLHIEDIAADLITPKGGFHGTIVITPEIGDEEDSMYYTLTYIFYERLGKPDFTGVGRNFNFQMFQATFYSDKSKDSLSTPPLPPLPDKLENPLGNEKGRKLLSMEDARREASEIFGGKDSGLVTGVEVAAASRKLQAFQGY